VAQVVAKPLAALTKEIAWPHIPKISRPLTRENLHINNDPPVDDDAGKSHCPICLRHPLRY
jgi:hypothetical protein